MSILKNRTVIGVLCIILSLAICFVVAPLFNKSASQKAGIVRVKQGIRAGELITADMVSVVEVGGYNLPDGVIGQIDTVLGRYATTDLFAGDYILAAKLSDTPATENAYLYTLDGTRQAISVTIKTFANGLSGKLQSGDIVSVIAADYRKQGLTVIPTELRYVEVISVTASSGYDANTGGQPDEDKRELPSTVTLFVTVEQSKVLAELEADGKLHLSLVYRGLPESAALFIKEQDEIITALIEAEEAAAAEKAAREMAEDMVEDVAEDMTEGVINDNNEIMTGDGTLDAEYSLQTDIGDAVGFTVEGGEE